MQPNPSPLDGGAQKFLAQRVRAKSRQRGVQHVGLHADGHGYVRRSGYVPEYLLRPNIE